MSTVDPIQAQLPTRIYPRLDGAHAARRPVSFVTVHFSGDLEHNLKQSECVRDPTNELIVVDNRNNLVQDTLGKAFEFGIAQAKHELVALIHEDVLLLPGWQSAMEKALAALEQHDPDWAFAGVAGWIPGGSMQGHWSDPHGYFNHLKSDDFAEVERIDEQIILFRRKCRISLDAALPSIHNLGRDLPRMAAQRQRRTYVINAPTIHKFADADGNRILSRVDSPKIRARSDLTYLADLACSDLYYRNKWSASAPQPVAARAESDRRLDAPIILLARGGGGSRLLSELADDAGIYRGSEVNASGDSLRMVQATYGSLLAKYRYTAAGLRKGFIAELRNSAQAMLRGSDAALWGYKLPESVLILDEIAEAFPAARFVHLIRDPLGTCLRRTHMTARYDNHVGQAALLAAYAATGRSAADIETDSPAMHMAITTIHQLEDALAWTRRLESGRLLELKFEDVLRDPADALQQLCYWLGLDVASARRESPSILTTVDPARADNPRVTYPAEVEREVAHLLAPLRQRLGYLS